MAYSGATAASSVANPPRCVAGGGLYGVAGDTTGLTTAPDAPNNQGGSMWFYASTNLTTDVFAAGFFSDGKALGMRPGDLVFGVQFSSAGSSVQTFVGAVTAITTADAATLSTGTMITSTFA